MTITKQNNAAALFAAFDFFVNKNIGFELIFSRSGSAYLYFTLNYTRKQIRISDHRHPQQTEEWNESTGNFLVSDDDDKRESVLHYLNKIFCV